MTNGNVVEDSKIEEFLRVIIENEGAYYGYNKLTYKLRSFGIVINKKKVYRLCKKMEILRPQRVIKAAYPRRLARNRDTAPPSKYFCKSALDIQQEADRAAMRIRAAAKTRFIA
jgi:hypothetical protein